MKLTKLFKLCFIGAILLTVKHWPVDSQYKKSLKNVVVHIEEKKVKD